MEQRERRTDPTCVTAVRGLDNSCILSWVGAGKTMRSRRAGGQEDRRAAD